MSAVPTESQDHQMVDVLLAEIAARVQLPPSRFTAAEKRYHSISAWIDRVESPLHGLVARTYAQGSMAIGATINRCVRHDEFDVDALAELVLPADTPARVVLDALFEAIRGEPGSRYYRMAERCTRCVQIKYDDDMHVDVTPTILRSWRPEREGYIFHAKLGTPIADDRRIIANPHGFAEWFKQHTPAETEFAESYAVLSSEYDATFREAESEPVPAPVEPYRKSRALVALQLLKRWRNIRYDGRSGRKPPSVLLAKLVADNANTTNSLFDEIMHQAVALQSFFETAQKSGRLVIVRNPVCRDSDIFSDRWPVSLRDQRVFIDDVSDLQRKLGSLAFGASIRDMKEVLSDLFGENPAADAVQAVARRCGRVMATGGASHVPKSGSFDLPGVFGALAATPTHQVSSIRTPAHRFYGGSPEDAGS